MRPAFALALAMLTLSGSARALDKVTFGTNWLADPEAGGFYQALVDGTYEKYGLDVTIMQGGPQSNGGYLLIVGKIEFYMGGDMLGDFLAVEHGIPTVAVAAEFQKDPQAFMSHPGVGLDKWTDLPKATALVSQTGIASFYAWMNVAWGFSDEKIKSYNFNSGPFVADPHSIQQGYVTSEPFVVETREASSPMSSCCRITVLWLRHDDRNAARSGRIQSRPRAAVRRCFRYWLVSLSLRRQQQRERGNQARKPRADATRRSPIRLGNSRNMALLIQATL